jgi:fatty-acyl-CoA synthase
VTSSADSETVSSLLRKRIGDQRDGYLFEDQRWTWDQVVTASGQRAAMLAGLRQAGPFHVGVLLDNVPEYLFLAGGAAFTGATIVGINPTRRGEELAQDIRHTNCQLIITNTEHVSLLDGLDLGAANGRIWNVDSPEYQAMRDAHGDAALPATDPSPQTTLFLLFTSGSTSAPKAVICSTGRMAMAGVRAAVGTEISADDVSYCCMPLFHGNALMACWAPSLAMGASVVLRSKFSASGFLSDVRRYGCTFFTYVGRSVAYVLAQPSTAADSEHRLRLGFGTEASALDRTRFSERFGCPLIEGYGSSESVIIINRTTDSPAGALGVPRTAEGADVVVINPETLQVCPAATFDSHGRLLNGNVAIGELVNRSGGGAFEGYYNNNQATTDRLRNGWYWSGDLAYVDEQGFYYFAGRNADWLRVDSENFAAAPIENIVHRFPDAVMVAVYPVPDSRTGDQVMVAIEMAKGTTFDPLAFSAFLAEQRDLGTKWAPRFVRAIPEMPLTANNKVNKQPLRDQAWITTDAVWWQPARGEPYLLLTRGDIDALAADFAGHQRQAFLPGQ